MVLRFLASRLTEPSDYPRIADPPREVPPRLPHVGHGAEALQIADCRAELGSVSIGGIRQYVDATRVLDRGPQHLVTGRQREQLGPPLGLCGGPSGRVPQIRRTPRPPQSRPTASTTMGGTLPELSP